MEIEQFLFSCILLIRLDRLQMFTKSLSSHPFKCVTIFACLSPAKLAGDVLIEDSLPRWDRENTLSFLHGKELLVWYSYLTYPPRSLKLMIPTTAGTTGRGTYTKILSRDGPRRTPDKGINTRRGWGYPR